ncbi:MAG: hypothetical protein ACKO3H_00945, partial [Verrucomicrobiota bacterium]
MSQPRKHWIITLGITTTVVAFGLWMRATRTRVETGTPGRPVTHTPGSPLYRVEPGTLAELSRLESREADAASRFWGPEQTAQRLGRTIESWWDGLRAASNRMAFVAQLPLGTLRVPVWDTGVPLPHDIRLLSPTTTGVDLDPGA